MRNLLKRYLAWRTRNAEFALNRSLHYQGGFISWIPAIAGIGSALIGSSASQSAADTQAQSAANATQAQQQMFQQTQQNVAPWLQAGQGALSQLVAGTQPGGALTPTQYTPFTTAQFQQDPGYQFQLQQMQGALQNQSSLTGGMNSNNLKSMLGYTQGLASTDYQQALNNYIAQFQLGNQGKQQQFANLSALSGTGLGAGLQQGQISANVGQQIGSNIIGAGNAQAAGTVGVANAITGAGSTAYNQWLQQQYLQQPAGTGASYSPWQVQSSVNSGAYASPYDVGNVS